MQPIHEPDPKMVAKITAVPWLVIWIAALVTLMVKSGSSGIPFEHLLAWVLLIAAPCMAWFQFKR